MIRRCLVYIGLLIGVLASAPAQEVQRVAVMVQRPSNVLAWQPVEDEAAFMLGWGELLEDMVAESAGLELISSRVVNGIQSGMEAGLYYPPGEGMYARWRPFLEADIYVEAEERDGSLTWRAGRADGTTLASPAVEQPRRRPMVTALALVRLVYEAAEVPLPADWEAELEAAAELSGSHFVEWAKWIGYRPHWLHHAPWQGPHTSARTVLEEAPRFHRGAAWALRMLQIPPKNRRDVPASPLYVPHALQLLDSRWAEAAMPFLRHQAQESEAVLKQLVNGFKLPELELTLGIDMEGDGDNDGLPPGADLSNLQFPETLKFRQNLALTLGGIEDEKARRVLITVMESAPAPEVRAAAAGALASFPAEAVAEPLRATFRKDKDDAPMVRAAALASLIARDAAPPELLREAAGDTHFVQRQLAISDLPTELKRPLLMAMLGSDEPALRAIVIEQLRTHPLTSEAAPTLLAVLTEGTEAERLAALAWIRRAPKPQDGFIGPVQALLKAESSAVRAEAVLTLPVLDAERVEAVVTAAQDDPSPRVRQALATALAAADAGQHTPLVFTLLERATPATRGAIVSATYQLIGDDRPALARAMLYDPELIVNLGALDLLQRLAQPQLLAEVLPATARDHANEYIRARALRHLHEHDIDGTRELALAALDAPWWIVRLEAADILADRATPADAERLRAAHGEATNEWLKLALEDALCQAEGRPIPERVTLNLGERRHMEGGDTPNGFQVWLGRLPDDPDVRRQMVEAGYRFGAKTVPANMPGGMVLNAYNGSVGARNTYLLDSILGPLREWENKLPYLYYLALFDEPGSLGGGYAPDRVRAMLLEAGRPDLLPSIVGLSGEALGEALPREYQRAYEWYNARTGAIASNWVVHLFRLTAQRKYQDLQLFPQSLSYMRNQTQDALHLIDADGDYTWSYHYGNYFRDGTLGGINRVLNPGKPLCLITWMSWHQPNVLNGNTLYADTEFPEGPWRLRNYMGTRSALSLWATGAEAGFFDPIGLGRASNKEAQKKLALAFTLKPWSETADAAIDTLLNDPGYWKSVEGQVALKLLKEEGGGNAPALDLGEPEDIDDDFMLEDGPTPLEKAMNEERQKLYTKLMTGISYMNIFNTDASRAMSNLPKPDTRPRDSLIILGRDHPFYADGSHFPIPAIAVLQGWDMCPTYDAVAKAELMQYDTILLRASRDGVTAPLVAKLNHWLREKEYGLLIVWGNVDSSRVQFAELTLDTIAEPLPWQGQVECSVREQAEESYQDHRGRERSAMFFPRMEAFTGPDGEHADAESRLYGTFSGALTPLLTTADGETILGRWQPPESSCIVLFDGATQAGPIYTEALERIILAIDAERGSQIQRNHWWGHSLYETDAFVVDVATGQLKTLLVARPRQHRGVDIITGVINPEVRQGECALVLKEYVGPYAGATGDWAVMAREALVGMEAEGDRLRVEARGVTRVTRIGTGIKLLNANGFEQVDNQVLVWKKMREGTPAYSTLAIDGGHELHIFSPTPFTVETE